nr:MAG TPA: hypothetical protein [Caudoviricetes sp.]
MNKENSKEALEKILLEYLVRLTREGTAEQVSIVAHELVELINCEDEGLNKFSDRELIRELKQRKGVRDIEFIP